MIVIKFRVEGMHMIEIECSTYAQAKHLTCVLIKYCESKMPNWAEIEYMFHNSVQSVLLRG